MSGIFLSYKRLDGDYATLLYAWLTERFGSAQVFWDHEDIEPGANFGDVLRERIRTAGALVALIGPRWEPSVWIRREIGGALRRVRTRAPNRRRLRAPVLEHGHGRNNGADDRARTR